MAICLYLRIKSFRDWAKRVNVSVLNIRRSNILQTVFIKFKYGDGRYAIKKYIFSGILINFYELYRSVIGL
ncbi:MAG TPA: hypothetical protein DD657_09210 [Culturomica sp.]|nr:hypothetical protein [Culturomica sp.]